MKRMLRVELNKALFNRWFFVALAIGCSLACASAVVSVSNFYEWGFNSFSEDRYYQLSTSGAVCAWIGISRLDTTFLPWLFFGMAPLLVCLPYAWSFRSELMSGYFAQGATRSTRRQCMLAKFAAVFLSSGLAMAVPLALSYLAVSCFIPGYVPDPGEGLSVPIEESYPFSSLFFSRPTLYFLAITVLDFLLCGSWGVMVLAASFVIENRVVLVAGSFLLQYFLHYANSTFMPLMLGNYFRLQYNLPSLLWPVANGDVPCLGLALALVALGTGGSLAYCLMKIRREQL